MSDDQRIGPDDRRDGPTPGAQKVLDEHTEKITTIVRIGLGAVGALFILLLIVGTIGFIKIGNAAEDARDASDDAKEAVNTANVERQARSEAVATVIEYGCNTDNFQDKQLAKLIQVSLSGGGGFGGGIDPNDLTPFELQVIGAIAHVQHLAESAPPTQTQEVFEQTEAELRDLADCEEIVKAFLAGQPIEPDPNPGAPGDPPKDPKPQK